MQATTIISDKIIGSILGLDVRRLLGMVFVSKKHTTVFEITKNIVYCSEGRKEMFYLMTHFNDERILFTVMWHRIYGKGPLR